MRPKGMQYLTTLLGAGVVTSPGLHESATATGSTVSYTDTTGPHNERYYRILWP